MAKRALSDQAETGRFRDIGYAGFAKHVPWFLELGSRTCSSQGCLQAGGDSRVGWVQGLDAPPRQPLLVAGGELPPSRRLLPRLTVPADEQAHGLFGALLNGVAGILSEPIRCQTSAWHGPLGFACRDSRLTHFLCGCFASVDFSKSSSLHEARHVRWSSLRA